MKKDILYLLVDQVVMVIMPLKECGLWQVYLINQNKCRLETILVTSKAYSGDKKNCTSLDLFTSLFNIDSGKSNIDHSQVNKVYYNKNKVLMRIVNYCQGDVIVRDQVYLKLKGLPAIKKDNITHVD